MAEEEIATAPDDAALEQALREFVATSGETIRLQYGVDLGRSLEGGVRAGEAGSTRVGQWVVQPTEAGWFAVFSVEKAVGEDTRVEVLLGRKDGSLASESWSVVELF